MRRGNEPRLKLRRREINAALQAAAEKFGEHFQIAPLRADKINNRAARKQQTQH